MSRTTEVVILIAMFLLRLGIPLAITFALGYFLKRLDRKWEMEARQQAQAAAAAVVPPAPAASKVLPCWLIKGCPPELARYCPAYLNQDMPCWLARLRAEGRVPKLCPTCSLFRSPTTRYA